MTDTIDLGIGRIIDAARDGVLHRLTSADGREFVILRDGDGQRLQEIIPITKALPDHTVQAVRIDAKESLVAYVQAYSSGAETRIFANLGKNQFVAVLDYHNQGGPGACDHRAVFELQESEQWQRWKAISGKLMGQADFVRFLEENCADIAAPSAGELHEICRDFSAKRRVDFREAVRLESGARHFEYVEEVKGTSRNGEIEVPAKFILQIPIYYGEPSSEVHAFLRYNIDKGLSLGIELHRPRFVQQASFEAIGRDVAALTARPIHYGALI